jgi:pilus assembly protein CpaB
MMMFLAVGGLVAAYVGKSLLAKEEAPAKVEIRTIPMAVGEIAPGTTITEGHIGLGRIPADKIAPDMMLSDRVVLGRVAKKPIPAGSPFTPDLLYPPGVRPPLDVTDGMRAVTVDLREASDLVDGQIAPGQYVDVHLTVAGDAGDARLAGGLTLTLFRGVRVLVINSGGGGMSRGTNSVTLELTPKQANVMILAQEKGKITMTYNPEGKGSGVVDVPEEDRATLDQILGLKPLPEPEPPFVSEHFAAGSRQVYEWQNGRRVDSQGGSMGAGEPQSQGRDDGAAGTSARGDGRSGAAVGSSAGQEGPSA